MRFGSGSNWCDFTPTGICEEYVDVTVLLFHEGIEPVQILDARYVARDRRDVFSDSGCGLFQLFLSSPGNHDVCTFLDEALRCGKANPAASSRDDCDLAFEYFHNPFPFIFGCASHGTASGQKRDLRRTALRCGVCGERKTGWYSRIPDIGCAYMHRFGLPPIRTARQLCHAPRGCPSIRPRAAGQSSRKTTCRSSVAGIRKARDQRCIRRKPAGHKLYEKPHTLGLARFAVREKPECTVLVQDGVRRSCQQRIGISDEARKHRHSESVPYRGDLRLPIRGFERNVPGGDLTFARPVRDAILADDDPPDAISLSRAPRGEQVAGHVDTTEEVRPLQAMKIEWQGVAIVDDADRNIGLSVRQIHQLTRGKDFNLNLGVKAREIAEIRHEQVCRKGWRQRHPQPPAHALIATEDARLQPVR